MEMRMQGYDDISYVTGSAATSQELFIATDALSGHVLAMGGVCNLRDLGFGVLVWMLATRFIQTHKQDLVREGRIIMATYLEKYKKLYNYISIANEPALRYIVALGAELYPPQKWGREGELFVPFVIKQKERG
nr:MAG TPA: internal virion protein A [Caudoviricetes sp.]